MINKFLSFLIKCIRFVFLFALCGFVGIVLLFFLTTLAPEFKRLATKYIVGAESAFNDLDNNAGPQHAALWNISQIKNKENAEKLKTYMLRIDSNAIYYALRVLIEIDYTKENRDYVVRFINEHLVPRDLSWLFVNHFVFCKPSYRTTRARGFPDLPENEMFEMIKQINIQTFKNPQDVFFDFAMHPNDLSFDVLTYYYRLSPKMAQSVQLGIADAKKYCLSEIEEFNQKIANRTPDQTEWYQSQIENIKYYENIFSEIDQLSSKLSGGQ